MKNSIQVNKFGQSRLTNAFHASFHHTVASQLKETGDESLGLPSEFADGYMNAVVRENDLVNKTWGSAKTEVMAGLDETRNNRFRAVRNALRNTKYTTVAELHALYDVIYKKLLKPYPAVYVEESVHTKSSRIRGFIFDVKQFITDSQMTALGIKADLTALETANDAYEKMYLERVDEYAQNPAGLTDECREEVDKYWAQLVRTINYFANETENASDTTKAIANNAVLYVEALNKHISEFLRSVNASGSRGDKDVPTSGTDKPTTGKDEPTSGTDKPTTGKDEPTSGTPSGGQKPAENEAPAGDGYKDDL